jgi:hypothetical protein
MEICLEVKLTIEGFTHTLSLDDAKFLRDKLNEICKYSPGYPNPQWPTLFRETPLWNTSGSDSKGSNISLSVDSVTKEDK